MLVDFYQVEHMPVARGIAQIAGRVLGLGQRLLVVAQDAGQRRAIGEALWAGAETFLANGEHGGPHDARQPVLLAESVAPANGARFVALADGLWREDVLDGRFERAMLWFDGETVVAARECWRALGSRKGLERRFWKQDQGRWTQAG